MNQDQSSSNGSSPSFAADEINLRDVWNLMVRNWAVLSVSLILAIGAAWVFSSMTVPVFESVTTIRIEEDKAQSVPVLDILQDLSSGSQVETEMEVLRSRTLAETVVDSLGLKLRVTAPKGAGRSTIMSGLFVEPWSPEAEYSLVRNGESFRIRNIETGEDLGLVSETERSAIPGATFLMTEAAFEFEEIHLGVATFNKAVEELRTDMSVSRPNRDASIITLRYESTDTQLVRTVPNLVAESFIDDRQDIQKTEARSTVAFLEEQIDTLDQQLVLAEEALVDYRQGEQVVSLGAEASAQVTQLTELEGQRRQIDAERAALQDLVDEVEADAARVEPGAPSPYRRLNAFPTLYANQASSSLLQ